jgi:hypothetical protein
MKDILLTDFEAWTLLGGVRAIVQRNVQSEKGMDYDILRKFLTIQKAFDPLAEALEKTPNTTIGDLKSKSSTYSLPAFKSNEWKALVRGEEAFILEKLSDESIHNSPS